MGFFENIQEKTQQLKEKTQNSRQKLKVSAKSKTRFAENASKKSLQKMFGGKTTLSDLISSSYLWLLQLWLWGSQPTPRQGSVMVSNASLKLFLVLQTIACFYICFYIYSNKNGILGGEYEFVKEKLGRESKPSMDIIKNIRREFPNLPVQHLLQQNRH